ncbi:2'-5' RNA ligase family protein [Hymenobacter sp. BT186]|uniref:2'-5' RNA ligase family protein n=1 Tax=Hymenobacter telluris TaxID=2816474 RepID=A0A939JB45_9BACT|nr:2'-5' RNA ligase family protein [Hymenobacter telluris]MBO0356413.1 2'-5' RNA ligase family protein [Hymenobacter telluris]MBW3372437.1 2'-5' RNA ligase family protein [Hymenobacter norwichensis]
MPISSPSVSAATPLILTLALDAETQLFFDELRQQHFPPERNYLAAHLTLFHHLPGADYATITEQLAQLATTQPPLDLAVTGVRFLGRGVAYTLECPPLQALHRALQTTWQPHLTPQDQQKLNPHVTVQNKVDPAVGRTLHQQLSVGFQPFEATGTGLHLWAYRNGPWEALQTFNFSG